MRTGEKARAKGPKPCCQNHTREPLAWQTGIDL